MKKNNGDSLNKTDKKNKNKIENNRLISEIVSKLIVDKIILLSTFEITNKKREKHISEITFEFSKKILDNIVNIKYMNYDKDLDSNDCNEIESPNLIEKDRDMYNILIPHCSKEVKTTSISEECNTSGILTKTTMKKNNSSNNNSFIKKNKIIIKSKTSKYFNNKNINNNNNDINIENKKKIDLNELYPFFTLDEKKYKIYEPNYISEMRDEFIEIMEKKKKLSSCDNIFKNENNNINNNKLFNNEKFTFDSNGNIINKKTYSNNNLKNDFILSKSQFKFVKLINNHNKKSFNNNNIKIDYNKAKFFFSRKNTNKNLVLCQPSGDNFDKISPEIGVIIKNKNNNGIKKGDLNFVGKYNKYSINEFNKIVDNFMKINNNLYSNKSNFTTIDNNNEMKEKFDNELLHNKNKIFNNNNKNNFNIDSNKNVKTENKNFLHNSNSAKNVLLNSHFENLKFKIDSINDSSNNLPNIYNRFLTNKNSETNINYFKKSFNNLKENFTSKTKRNEENENYKIFFNLDSNNKNNNNLINFNKNKIIKQPKKPDYFKLKYHNGILMNTERTFRVKQIKKSFSSRSLFDKI